MTKKRLFDLAFTVPGLFLLAPLFLVIGLFIKLDSPGPVFFRQVRLGRQGKPFRIYKFRTMVDKRATAGIKITPQRDARITRAGRLLRNYKLDEFPQLINVLKGEMSLVGPRPEVPEYVREYPADARAVVLSVPPGITDLASIEYRDESLLLGNAGDPEQFYITRILPVKVAYYAAYAREHNLALDLKIVLKTFRALYCPRGSGIRTAGKRNTMAPFPNIQRILHPQNSITSN